jgi:hypothetical protein
MWKEVKLRIHKVIAKSALQYGRETWLMGKDKGEEKHLK